MKTQWQVYKELELIPESVPSPVKNRPVLTAWFLRNWQSLWNSINRKHMDGHPIEFLEGCLALDYSRLASENRSWHKIRQSFNHFFANWDLLPTYPEPQIRRIFDHQGQAWWHAYDPVTGQAVYLETEEEVQIWLEERLYH
ncbi:MAG: hypothetical protein KME16_09900 [Scytolyngbya sp. HA4215-MV1]|jgi:hypothetical protein|nr:hypothetical protein [Scytolyngbya sp. HA4215-MV1]